jgi:hypothetical protein
VNRVLRSRGDASVNAKRVLRILRANGLTAGAGRRTGHEDALARQMLGQRTAGAGSAAWVAQSGALGFSHPLGHNLVFGDTRLQIL